MIELDCLIAAPAVARELVLVTDNLRAFRRVPGLHCENGLRRSNRRAQADPRKPPAQA